MTTRILASILAVPLMLAAIQPAAAVGDFVSGNWKGSAYFTGPRFTHCAMSAGFDAGWRLVFTLQNNGDVILGLAHPTLNLTTGSTAAVQIQIDNGPTTERQFLASAPQLLGTTFTANGDLFQRLRKGSQLKIKFGTIARTFSLKGANEALNGLFGCAAKYRNA
jgi:hypothetical protein